jgi:hypothetical protein
MAINCTQHDSLFRCKVTQHSLHEPYMNPAFSYNKSSLLFKKKI